MKLKEYYYKIKIKNEDSTIPDLIKTYTWQGKVFAHTKREATWLLHEYFAEDGIIESLTFTSIFVIEPRVDNAKNILIEY